MRVSNEYIITVTVDNNNHNHCDKDCRWRNYNYDEGAYCDLFLCSLHSDKAIARCLACIDKFNADP
jgi:hypothetical protein